MSKILITGSEGFIGSHLARSLIEDGHEVVGLDDYSGGIPSNVPVGLAKEYVVDVSDKEAVRRVFCADNFDIVVHAAAYAAEGLSPFVRNFNYTNNLIGTTNIVNGCINQGVGRLVFMSSIAVYGAGSPPFSEDDDYPAPEDPYGVAKFCAELDIRSANKQFDLDYCILRPHNVYGPGQNIWDKYRNVFGIWMNRLLNGKDISIFGDGNQSRAFSYIGDCIEPMKRACFDDAASRQTINIGGINPTLVRVAADILEEATGKRIKKTFLKKRKEVEHAWATTFKSTEILGYQDNTSLLEGVTAMWEWAKRMGDTISTPKFPEQEVYSPNYEIEWPK